MSMEEQKYFDDKQLYKLIFENDFLKIKDFLKKYGVNSRDRSGATFLMSCVVENKIDLVIKLIDFGVDINAKDADFYTALHYAVQEKHIEIIDLLLSNDNIKIDIQDSWGHTPLLRILTNGNRKDPMIFIIVEKLINKGASLDIENSSGQTPRSMMQEITNEKIIDTNGDLVDYSKFLK